MTEAEQLWREACYEFLRACFRGSPTGVIAELGRALLLYASEIDIARLQDPQH